MPKLQSHCGNIENSPIDPNFWLGSYFMTHHQNILPQLDQITLKKSMGEKNTLGSRGLKTTPQDCAKMLESYKTVTKIGGVKFDFYENFQR